MWPVDVVWGSILSLVQILCDSWNTLLEYNVILIMRHAPTLLHPPNCSFQQITSYFPFQTSQFK